jgi:hypothetical protein
MKISFHSTRKLARSEIRMMSEKSIHKRDTPIRDEDLMGLPAIVQKYLRRSRVIGKAWVHTVRLQQRGQIRMAPGTPWMDLVAEQHFFTDPPGFIWYARVRKGPLLTFSGRDKLFKGKGNMMIKASVFVVVDEKGEKLDQGAMMRYLSEMIWFPTALLGPYVQWEAVHENAAKATLTCGNKSVSGTFIFNDDGDVTDFQAQRYMDTGKNAGLLPWHTPVNEYGQPGGYHIPVRGSAVWTLEDGAFTYIDVEITGIEYNPDL